MDIAAINEFLHTHPSFTGLVLFVLTYLVDISPIKINPLKWIGSRIGKLINSETISRLASLETAVSGVKADIAMDKAEGWRAQILRFGDECRTGIQHSQEFFNQILDTITDYEQYCVAHPDFRNNKASQNIEIIRDAYHLCLKENKFL